jgi:hypothetical protein
VVVKRSLSSGARKWTRRYDGPAHGDEMCTGVGVDGAGNVVVSGTTLTSSGIQGVVASWTKGGAKRWIWRYDAGGHTITTFNGLLVRSDGGIYVAGMGLAAGGKSVAVTARLRRTGTPVWVRKYFGPENMGATLTGITARPGGGVYVYGDTLTAATAADGLVLRYLPSGKRKRFTLDTAGAGTTNEVFTDLAVTSVKSVVAVGYSQGATQDCHVATYRSDGAMLTSGTSVTPSSNDHYVAVTSDAFGGYYVTGTYHVAAGDCRIRTFRASVLSGGGGWSALWTAVPSIATSPTAIAVRGTRCCVVGHYDAGVGAGVDQIVLFYTY